MNKTGKSLKNGGSAVCHVKHFKRRRYCTL